MKKGSLGEWWYILRKLSSRKAVNIFLLKASYVISRIAKRGLHYGYPMALSIEPTTACNLRCPECPSGLRSFSRATGMMNLAMFKQIIDQLHVRLAYLNLYFQGEPFLNPAFFDMIRYASSKNIYISTSTNAHYLNENNARKIIESGLDKLIISVDGADQESYSSYRIGGNLSKVLDGVKTLVREKKIRKSAIPMVVMQCIVMKSNQHQVKEMVKIAQELGVDIQFKTAQVYRVEVGKSIVPDNPSWSRYKVNGNGTLKIKNQLDDRCWRMWSSAVITWDGRIVPCCFDKDAQHQMGDLTNESFKDIWGNDIYRNFRNTILNGRDQIDICRNCSEGGKVWI